MYNLVVLFIGKIQVCLINVDPQKWWDLENLTTLLQVDFYLTLGNTTTQIPLDLNGLGFSIKLGMLCYEDTMIENSTSTYQGMRATKRIKPME